MLAGLLGLDSLVLYFAVAAALFFSFASVWYSRSIAPNPEEPKPGYLASGRQARILWTILFYVIGALIWTMLTFGRGRTTPGLLIYGSFALVFSLLSVLNAWRESGGPKG